MTGSERQLGLSLSRRAFLGIGVSAAAGCSSRKMENNGGNEPVRGGRKRRRLILICNLGGPSQLDTWDPKPEAELEVRGPFRAIRTRVPGLIISELFPRHARIARHLAFVRSCSHDSPAVHHVAWRRMQTGREFMGEGWMPHIGCLAGYLLGSHGHLPPHVLVPGALRTAARRHAAGQSAGLLGRPHEPRHLDAARLFRTHGETGSDVERQLLEAANVSREPEPVRAQYGNGRLGRHCLVARRLIERDVRCVTLNSAVDLLHEKTWDVHGRAPSGPVKQLQQTVAPAYDQAVPALIEDLEVRGLLADTLVCCLAEFGRTPRMNASGGRDHWPRCFTIYFAGGGVRGGQVIGRSDASAGEPADRAVRPAEIAASIYHALGLNPSSRWLDGNGHEHSLVDDPVQPIRELFA